MPTATNQPRPPIGVRLGLPGPPPGAPFVTTEVGEGVVGDDDCVAQSGTSLLASPERFRKISSSDNSSCCGDALA